MTHNRPSDAVDIRHGDALDVLRSLPDESVEAFVTDPPYGLGEEPDMAEVLTHWLVGDDYKHRGGGFMGRTWDSFVPGPAVWREAYRVLKPGGHLLCFAGTRTSDLMGISIRLAGFEIRDRIRCETTGVVLPAELGWQYGAGFPKSHNLGRVLLPLIEERYGQARCDCLVAGDGHPRGDGQRREGGGSAGHPGGPGAVPTPEAGTTDVQVDARAGVGGVRELREADASEAEGAAPVTEAVLRDGVRGSRAEDPRLGRAAVRAGLEGAAGVNPGTGQDLPRLREDTGGERRGVAGESPRAVPLRGDEPAGESGGAVRVLPSPGGRDRGERTGGDPDRGEARRLILDGGSGGGDALARVCSWCALPDRDWVSGLGALGTALKPAYEPIIVARKPLAGTVAQTVLTHGTGALNIAATRVAGMPPSVPQWSSAGSNNNWAADGRNGAMSTPHAAGRWPSNVVLTHSPSDPEDGCEPGCPVAELDRQSGVTSTTGRRSVRSQDASVAGTAWGTDNHRSREYPGESGTASRFFPTFRYQAKADGSERPSYIGPVCFSDSNCSQITDEIHPLAWPEWARDPKGACPECGTPCGPIAHPTVKPLDLMRWLVRLVVAKPRPGEPEPVVVDMFAGTGPTGEACIREGGIHCILGDKVGAHIPLIEQRIRKYDDLRAMAAAQRGEKVPTRAKPRKTADDEDDLFADWAS